MPKIIGNRVDPYEVAHNDYRVNSVDPEEAAHLELHCSGSTLYTVCPLVNKI